jgi:hypothetical protein
MTRGIALITSLMLAGCATTNGLSPTQVKPVCTALIGPLRYNTFNKDSRRHAGPDLAVDLHQRNSVGQQLGCPQYKIKP